LAEYRADEWRQGIVTVMRSSQIAAPANLFASDFARARGQLAAPAWLSALRSAGETRFLESGLPTTSEEDWRYTSLVDVAQGGFRWAGETAAASAEERGTGFRDLDLPPLASGGVRLVFVDGTYHSELSNLDDGYAGAEDEIWIGSLAAAVAAAPTWLEEHLGRHAKPGGSALVGLNSAFLQDGAVLHLPAAARLDLPLHLLFIATGGGVAVHPRVLVCAGQGSVATVVEEYRSVADSSYYNNAVVELSLAASAAITHVRVVAEANCGYHTALVQVVQYADSRYNCHQVTLGGALVRADTRVELAAPGAECVLRGLYALRGKMHVDHHTFVDHASPDCRSDERFKGVVDDVAHAVFNGRVLVRPDAQKTVAMQQNANVLLSADACVDTKPELEIYADDVKCEHGATIGQMDPQALFYLRSRGLDAVTARTMLVRGFAAEIIDGIGVPGLSTRLHDELFGAGPQAASTAATGAEEA
jgi:Fe-S cluster assembly protein SufD